MQMQYDKKMVEPMWRQLEGIGVPSLTSAKDVDAFLTEQKGTSLIVINSVCGCAAGTARPGVAIALQNKKIPNQMATVFAGVDKEATEQARTYLTDMPPSSPSVALLKDGKVVYMLHRKGIEGYDEQAVADKLIEAFDEHCEAEGPSVPWDNVLKAFDVQGDIPRK